MSETLREALSAYLDKAESGADMWGTCTHEWLSLAQLRALLAEHPATPAEEAGEVAEGDREALAEVLCHEYHPMHWDVTYHNRTRRCQACAIHTHRILASDWLRDHDAALTAKARAEAWDEGYLAGWDDRHADEYEPLPAGEQHDSPNPHRDREQP